MMIECWQHGQLVKRHVASDRLTNAEVLRRFGLNQTWTVCVYPDGRPDQLHTIQRAEVAEV